MALQAVEADHIYGDSFTRSGSSVVGIGNNVSLVFERMDFGNRQNVTLKICGSTQLAHHPITVRIQNDDGDEITQIAEFAEDGGHEQSFCLQVPGGMCTVTFVFLPGSQFDFAGFQFIPANE